MQRSHLRTKLWALLATVAAGGTLFSKCELRLRDAFINASKGTLVGLLDPSNLTIGGTDTDTNGSATGQ